MKLDLGVFFFGLGERGRERAQASESEPQFSTCYVGKCQGDSALNAMCFVLKVQVTTLESSGLQSIGVAKESDKT